MTKFVFTNLGHFYFLYKPFPNFAKRGPPADAATRFVQTTAKHRETSARDIEMQPRNYAHTQQNLAWAWCF